MKKEPILSVKDLSVSFQMYDNGLEKYDLKVISNLTLDVRPGEIVAIAGSSGSGKSLLAHAVMGLLPENASISGEISVCLLSGPAYEGGNTGTWKKGR